MTNMLRVSISIPDDIDRQLLDLRKSDTYARLTYSGLVRLMVQKGLETVNAVAQGGPVAGGGE